VGDRANTRVEQRILHLDVAATAIKLVQKGSVRVFLRFDAINQASRPQPALGRSLDRLAIGLPRCHRQQCWRTV
jgi:hypothetical protein